MHQIQRSPVSTASRELCAAVRQDQPQLGPDAGACCCSCFTVSFQAATTLAAASAMSLSLWLARRLIFLPAWVSTSSLVVT